MEIAFSQACENNKHPILAILSKEFNQTQNVLEIGSGTGQHAVYFAEHLNHLTWFTSDLVSSHFTINHRVKNAKLTNLKPPLALDLSCAWQQALSPVKGIKKFDAIFTANTLHIVSWPLVKQFFHQAGQHLISGGKCCIYGPFNYQGQYTSDSNANFDFWLKQRDANSGIRDIEQITEQAQLAGLHLIKDHQMPANNRLLTFIAS
ncbi:methylase [Thalassotalea insulae]|uniref:Methylase n=1 Tax=Thalassotalea insulae TaxID=2056778 RepID=A0ABQ6GLT0_9GAMM|nr:DUF938 domain-containing protein [Thalassotalea insulae]GLX76965.1 methylase [Thalassotalea insulae]